MARYQASRAASASVPLLSSMPALYAARRDCAAAAPARGSPDLIEVAVPPEPVAESGGAGHAVRDQSLATIVPLLDKSLAHAETMALDGAAAVSAHAHLREVGVLLGQLLGLRP